jgi:carbamate kinase
VVEMLVVMALGRAALLEPGQAPGVETQRANLEAAVEAVAAVARHHDVVVTHGSAPQVGLLAYESALMPGVADYPLDVVAAETQGLVGYLLQQELANELPGREVVTLLTQVAVDPADAAFQVPAKRVGPPVAQVDAERLTTEHGWVMVPEGRRYRRVVPSPEPLAVVERDAVERLVRSGAVVICAGGGGIPVVVDPDGSMRGVDAVIDKDLSAALLATLLHADALLLLTDVAAVSSDWGTAFARPIHQAAPAQLRALRFPSESMGPKVAAACRFAERTGKRAAIGAIPDAGRVLLGDAGTQVCPGTPELTWHSTADLTDSLLGTDVQRRNPETEEVLP